MVVCREDYVGLPREVVGYFRGVFPYFVVYEVPHYEVRVRLVVIVFMRKRRISRVRIPSPATIGGFWRRVLIYISVRPILYGDRND